MSKRTRPRSSGSASRASSTGHQHQHQHQHHGSSTEHQHHHQASSTEHQHQASSTRHQHPHLAPSTQHPAPRRRFAQHFLEPPWVDKLLRAIDPHPDDTIVEIGPGRGALTGPLAVRVERVIAYEIDRDLAAWLRASMPANVTIVEGDFLDHAARSGGDEPPSGARRLRVAANLPYNVASPIMFALVDWSRRGVPLVDATLMLQREVADRLTAAPGSRDYGVLSILIGHRATATRVLTLPPGAFRPPPKVQSAVVHLTFHPPDPPVRSESAFAALVKALFTHRRKTLANALRAFLGTHPGTEVGTDPGTDPGTEVGTDPGTQPGTEPGRDVRRRVDKALALALLDGRRRPETLSIAELARLADILVV